MNAAAPAARSSPRISSDFRTAAVLARNLTKPDYIALLCGTIDDLPRAFAAIDADDRSLSLPARLRALPLPEHDVVSSSLPKADRDLVRTDVLRDRVLAEARSRAPRREVRGKTAQANRRLTP